MDVAQIAKGLSVGIIMDGNGRWAKKRGLPRNAGHKKGAEVFSDLVHYCNELELAAVTFYAFSTENWKRPQSEVAGIMRLFREYLVKAFDYEKENNRVVFLGDRTPLDAESQRLMAKIEENTRHKTGMILNIAINYGGRDELVCAARQLAELVRDGKLAAKDITAEAIQQHLYTHGQPDPDLILRPSGEERLSNFLIWQSAYSEFVFQDVLWPDFTRTDLDRALLEYARRSRRFGGI